MVSFIIWRNIVADLLWHHFRESNELFFSDKMACFHQKLLAARAMILFRIKWRRLHDEMSGNTHPEHVGHGCSVLVAKKPQIRWDFWLKELTDLLPTAKENTQRRALMTWREPSSRLSFRAACHSECSPVESPFLNSRRCSS